MKLDEYIELQNQLLLQKQELINEILSLLGEEVARPVAKSVSGFSYLKVIKRSQIEDKWGVDNFLNSILDEDLRNLRLVLESSRDIVKSLNSIVNYGNMAKKIETTSRGFFKKVKPEWIEIFKDYLESHYQADTRTVKRNIAPYKSFGVKFRFGKKKAADIRNAEF